MIRVYIKFHAQVAEKLGKSESYLELVANITWPELFNKLEQALGLSLRRGVFTMVNNKTLWAYLAKDDVVDTETVSIEVFPALVGG